MVEVRENLSLLCGEINGEELMVDVLISELEHEPEMYNEAIRSDEGDK